jgi:hypothetical protein
MLGNAAFIMLKHLQISLFSIGAVHKCGTHRYPVTHKLLDTLQTHTLWLLKRAIIQILVDQRARRIKDKLESRQRKLESG